MINYNPDKPAIISADKPVSYSELAGAILSFAKSLQDYNPLRVVICAENRPEWIYAFYAIWHCEATVVPVDFKSNASDIAYILKDCSPDAIICSHQTRETIEKAISLSGFGIPIILMEDVPVSGSSDQRPCENPGNRDRIALIVYTSGTTGSPKGVMLSIGNILANTDGVSRDVKVYNSNDNILVLLPLHHIFPLLGTVVINMYAGSTAVFSPSLQPADIMKTLQAHKITMIIGVPRLYEAFRKGIQAKIEASMVPRVLFRIARRLDKQAISRLVFGTVQRGFGGAVRYMVSGGSRLDPETAIFFRTLGFEVLEGYGMTEAAPMITFTRPGGFIAGSAGQALPVTQIEIRQGEITASGPNIMKGYYNRPGETSDILRDGWLYTGDLGYLDDSGHLFITGRKKEIIVLSNGKNINPVEIEVVLEAMDPMIEEAAICLVEDRLHALIRPAPAMSNDNDSVSLHHLIRTRIIDVYNREATPHKIIHGLSIVNTELPRTSMGKLRRFMLENYVQAPPAKPLEPGCDLPESEEQTVIRNYLSALVGRDVLPGDHLESSLGMDSLDKVTFQVFLKKTFGIELDQTELANLPSIGALSTLVRERKTQIDIAEVNWADVFKETTHVKLPRSWVTSRLLKLIAKLFLKCYFRLSAENVDSLPDGPFIIAPNHQSYIDGLFVAVFLKNRHFSKTYFYAKAKHLKNWLLRFIADRHNVIIMDINKDVQASLQKLASVLKQGRNIMIFPEGTRSRDGQIGDFRKTFAILSRELSVPVVPVTIIGAREALPPGARFPRPFRRVSVIFQDPVYPGDESYESLTETVKTKIIALLKPDKNAHLPATR
ncbi:AMP-binding protein [bacterium]|nr:AMP-binding protein [candidate division CSSED10-310 bacterium]